MRILDLDLDFFVDQRVTYVSDYGKRADDSIPWELPKLQDFLENQCGLSSSNPTKGRVVEHHHEAFFFWRDLIDNRKIELPFEVVHIDAHSDLGVGIGDGSQAYIMTELLHRPLAERMNLKQNQLKPGNYLAFAVACRWISKITFVSHPLWKNDLPWRHFKDWDVNSRYLQLKKCAPEDDFNTNPEKILILELEPEIPFEIVSGIEYKSDVYFSFITLSHSPRYTPPAADQLLSFIKEYIEEI